MHREIIIQNSESSLGLFYFRFNRLSYYDKLHVEGFPTYM